VHFLCVNAFDRFKQNSGKLPVFWTCLSTVPKALESALIRHTVQPFTESDDTRCYDNTICPPEAGIA
jgi:hypothetical protein